MRPPLRDLLQSRLREHCQKLTSRAHIDRLRHHFAAAVVHKALGNTFHDEKIIHLAPRIEQHGIANPIAEPAVLAGCGKSR